MGEDGVSGGAAEAAVREGASGMAVPGLPDLALRTAAIRRAVVRLCLALHWSPLHEVTLPNGRRADVLALRQDGGFMCVEIKSSVRDFQSDAKWQEYQPYCDGLFFAVDVDFPVTLVPASAGLIVASDGTAEVLRTMTEHRMPGSRRRVMLQRFAELAALRLVAVQDPAALAESRAALLVE